MAINWERMVLRMYHDKRKTRQLREQLSSLEPVIKITSIQSYFNIPGTCSQRKLTCCFLVKEVLKNYEENNS